MRSAKRINTLTFTVGAIYLSLIGVSVGGALPEPEGPGPARSPQVRPRTRANHDAKKQLMIDPGLTFVSTLGTYATTHAIAVDQAGNSYIAGTTEVFEFTTTPGAFQPTCPNGTSNGSSCAFVAKIDPSGGLIYSTYLSGSSGDDVIYGIAVDSAGDAYVTGWAVSSDFPVLNAFQPTLAGDADAFVAELNPTGSGLIYSSYLGGANDTKSSNLGQVGLGIAVDATGAAYVVGQTNASEFPTTPGAFQTTFGGGTCGPSTQLAPCPEAFITKVAPGGGSLVYSTFLGGSTGNQALGVAVDAAGDAFVAGGTTSLDFPTLNAFQPTCATFVANGTTFCADAFVTELDPTGTALAFSTHLGGSGTSGATALALDGVGDVYVTGITNAPGFPVVNAFQASFPSTDPVPRSAFVSEFAAGGASLIYSTYLGGSAEDFGYSVAVDGFGEAFVTGLATSSDFPVANALQTTNQGALADAFVTSFQAGGNGLVYSTYLGGPAGSSTQGWGIAVDSQGDAWVGGDSDATTFPAAMSRPEVVHRYVSPGGTQSAGLPVGRQPEIAPTPGRRPGSPLQSSSGVTAALAGSIALDMARVHAAPASFDFGAELAGTTSEPETVTISNPGTAPLTFSGISASDSFAVPSGGSCSTSSPVAPGGNCTVDVAFAPTVGGSLTGTLTLTDNGIGSPHSVPLSGTGQDFTLSTNSNSASVAAGGTATFNLSVASQGGFNHSLDLSCTDPASLSTCTVSPTSVNPTAANPATATVSITTTAPSQVGPRGPNGPWPGVGAVREPPLLAALAMLALLAVAAMSSSPRVLALVPRRFARRWVARSLGRPNSAVLGLGTAYKPQSFWKAKLCATGLALALLLVLAWAGCGGGSTLHNPGTPAGTYTVTLKAADTQANLSHSTTVTLTVN